MRLGTHEETTETPDRVLISFNNLRDDSLKSIDFNPTADIRIRFSFYKTNHERYVNLNKLQLVKSI